MNPQSDSTTLLESANIWPLVRLSDGLIANLQTGFACGNHNRDGLGIVHIRPMNVTLDGEISLADVKYVPLSEADRDERLVRSGDVIFNNTNSPELVGKTGLYTEPLSSTFSNHMTRLRPYTELVRPRYLALALHQLWREGYFADKCNNHVSQASISRAVLLETEIPLPPVNVQDALLLSISSLQQRVNSTRDRLAVIPTLLKRFRQSVLAAACSGELTADLSSSPWGLHKLSEITSKIGSGSTPRGGASSYQAVGVPLIRSMNVVFFGFKYEGLAYLDADQARLLNSVTTHSGDVLLNITGASIGRVTVLPNDLVGGRVNQHVCILRPRSHVLSHFLCLWLSSPEGQAYIQAENYGVSREALTMSQIKNMDVPIPAIEEQVEIVRRVESLFALADSIESRLAEATSQVERTTQAILAKAFKGEL